MSSLEQNIRVAPDTLANLMVAVEKGQYRIPQFQRDYVWEVSKVRKLFDSIYREYPIGSFFLWKAGREHNQLFRHSPGLDVKEVRSDDDVTFILDGQQRITSLYVTLKGLTRLGTDYSRLCFDLKEKKFIHRNPDRTRFVAVCEVWGPDSGKLSRQIEEKYHSSYDRLYRTLHTYPVSIVEVRDKQLDAVCRIFQRINQGGKRLDRFDLIAAMTFDPEFDLRERVDEDIIRPIMDRGFGKIPRGFVTQLIALTVKGACTDTAQYGLTRDDIHNNWKAVIDSIMLSIDFLKANCYVLRFEFLPYNPIITLVAYYFMKSGQRSMVSEHQDWMVRWFWRSAFGQRYGAGGATRIAADGKIIDELIQGRKPEFEIPHVLDEDSLIRTKMTLTGSAVRCGFLCLLASRNPLHLKNNARLNLITGSISDFTSAEKHHIFPQAFLRREGSSGNVHSLPNFCFIPAELNKELSDRRPSEYFSELARFNPDLNGALDTHLLPPVHDSGIDEDDYPKFLQGRARIVLAAIQDVCGWATRPARTERHAAVERSETLLRDFIDYVLTEAYGDDCWKAVVPGDVQEQIKRLSKPRPGDVEGARHVQSTREKLDLCDSTHYLKIIIIKQNWPYFEPYLHYKSDVERHLRAFSEYRNCVMHNRELPQVAQMLGEAALTWLANVIPSLKDIRGEGDDESSETENANNHQEQVDSSIAISGARADDEEESTQVPKKVSERRARPWDLESYLEDAAKHLSGREVEVLQQLHNWSEEKAERISWGTGKRYASFGPKFTKIGRGALFTVWSVGDITINVENKSAAPEHKENKHRLANVLHARGFFSPRLAGYSPEIDGPWKYPTITTERLLGRVDDFLNIVESEMGLQ